MNFLAHLVLCDGTPAGRLGSVLPDLMRVKNLEGLPEGMRRAVEQHRRVDRATDGHAAFMRCREALTGELGRYSGICLDVFFDHVLSVRWGEWMTEPREAFIAGVYRDVTGLGELAPQEVRPVLARMAEQDWLGAYGSIEGIRMVMGRMSLRMSERFEREVDLRPCADVLERRYGEVEEAFLQVWRHVRQAEGLR
jgi:acyl carrier protein phosphodiesterase